MLNQEQFNASRSHTGYSLILAGAGTGKTTTLVEKVSTVIQAGIAAPGQILLLTFSRAAAEEMKSRINNNISDGGIFAGTYHSIALTLLKEYAEKWCSCCGYCGVPVIIDGTKREEILTMLISLHLDSFLGMPLPSILWLFNSTARKKSSHYKGFSYIEPALALLDAQFDAYKKEHRLTDFDDIIKDFCFLLENDHTLRHALQERFSYIFIDEFQDIAENTLAMVKLLLPERGGNLCAVGDDAQAIYSFMGSTPEHIRSFKKIFPDAHIFRLTQNYRSHYEIVSLSNSIIARNSSLVRKKLHAVKGRGGIVRFHPVENLEDEHRTVKDLISGAMEKHHSAAVLYRNNWQIDSLIKGMDKQNENIYVLTAHAAKGLEYDTVIIAGIRDGVFPFYSSEIEEERRLFYVALTRARIHLHIVYYCENGKPAQFASECLDRTSPIRRAEAVFTLDKVRTAVSAQIKGAMK